MVTDGPKKSTSRHWVPTIKSLSSLYVMGNDPKSKQGHKIDRQVLKGDILKPQIRAFRPGIGQGLIWLEFASNVFHKVKFRPFRKLIYGIRYLRLQHFELEKKHLRTSHVVKKINSPWNYLNCILIYNLIFQLI